MREIEPDEGTIRHGTRLEIAYFDQQREQLDPERTVADTINDGNDTVIVNGQPKHIIGYLADFLFPRERALSPVKSLSGGERNRLLLARLFARPANVLVLDEPTNDLDIETLELLEELVGDFDGTVLLVSHDRVFLDRVVTSTLAFEGQGRVTEYVGGYEDYLRQRSRPRVRLSGSAAGSPTVRCGSDGSSGCSKSRGPRFERRRSGERPRKLSFKEQRELEALPARIEALKGSRRRLQSRSRVAGVLQVAGGPHPHACSARIETRSVPELDAALDALDGAAKRALKSGRPSRLKVGSYSGRWRRIDRCVRTRDTRNLSHARTLRSSYF